MRFEWVSAICYYLSSGDGLPKFVYFRAMWWLLWRWHVMLPAFAQRDSGAWQGRLCAFYGVLLLALLSVQTLDTLAP